MADIDKIILNSKVIDGIYGQVVDYGSQKTELQLRTEVANRKYTNYLDEISLHHSIPVMDAEVEKFMEDIPKNGWILDVGGCWGWHWRNIHFSRPDVKIVILDLVRENLYHAKNILKDNIDKNIFLFHGNALSLEFGNNVFDGVWSVQTTQHIPNYKGVVLEVFRVLKSGGIFIDYNLNTASLTRLIYQLFGKRYHLEGDINGSFFLRRVNEKTKSVILEIFGNDFRTRNTEILFSPELGFPIGGKEKSILGKIDSLLSCYGRFWSLIARQSSFHVRKK